MSIYCTTTAKERGRNRNRLETVADFEGDRGFFCPHFVLIFGAEFFFFFAPLFLPGFFCAPFCGGLSPFSSHASRSCFGAFSLSLSASSGWFFFFSVCAWLRAGRPRNRAAEGKATIYSTLLGLDWPSSLPDCGRRSLSPGQSALLLFFFEMEANHHHHLGATTTVAFHQK